VTLLDLLDRLLQGGVVAQGDISLAVADIDLVNLSLRLAVGSDLPGAGPAGLARAEHPGRSRTEHPDRRRIEEPDRGRVEEPDRGRIEEPDRRRVRSRPGYGEQLHGRARPSAGRARDRPHSLPLDRRPSLGIFADDLDRVRSGLERRLNADEEKLERGLAQLVMTVIELLRQLMERQAVHRMEGGSLSAEEVERLGRTFMALAERMEELKESFGLSDEDLNLNLGPLGNLM
jgi:hypothetical protein